MNSSTLFVIPARAGSKGVPNKNKRLLSGKPLIAYTIEEALKVISNEHICVSTDDEEVITFANKMGLEVPFVRPEALAQDDSTSRDVLLHAIDFYASMGKFYERVVMLQPTSPLRKSEDILGALALFNDEVDCVLSVVETKSNPYYVLFEEGEEGYLKKSKKGFFQRRQDCPAVYELNGAVYVIRVDALKQKEITLMDRIVKFEMSELRSIDIDTELDFKIAEFLLN
ncbi:acylneuraminate cytidylyltransferase family protein [Ekhidna sp.]|uniref:acylneuraminate cytidylyltransferase family protein n=1 Tax=Ekhidna sp. TaxID=2608089 RepID=UPI0032972371